MDRDSGSDGRLNPRIARVNYTRMALFHTSNRCVMWIYQFDGENQSQQRVPLMSQTLDQLPIGTTGTLGRPEECSNTVLRLMEMGMTRGEEVTLTRRAPWGDPLEVEIRGTRLCLRRADAKQFPVSADAPTLAKRSKG